MGEIVTLTDDIDGPDVTADERVRFGLDGKAFEIDLTADHAAKLRECFAGLNDLTRLRATIDGREIDARLPTPMVTEFREALRYWTEHARKSGTQAPRVKREPAKQDAPAGPVIDPNTVYWNTPHNLSHGSKAAAPWSELREDMRAWGERHGYPRNSRGVISHALGRNYALAVHGKAFEMGPQATDTDKGKDNAK